MKCPVCNEVSLVMSERQGVEIDYCPECRGVWLDRGELDKILERAAVAAPQEASRAPQYGRQEPEYKDRGHDYKDRDYNHQQHKKRKPGGFLGDIFDF